MTPIVSLTAITTILLFLSLHSSLSAFVVDILGFPVRNAAGSYIIIPEGRGGRLALTERAGEPPCPNYITRKPFSRGIPMTIYSPLKILYLPTSVRVDLIFHANATMCAEPLRWRVTNDKSTGQLYVVTGGTPPTTPLGYFTIEEAKSDGKRNTYKIRYCSSADGDGKCGYVGFFRDGLMGITNENPLFARFMRVRNNSGFWEF